MKRICIGLSIWDFVITAALAFTMACAMMGCKAQPLPDLAKVQRGQFSRSVTDSTGATCHQWLPLVARTEFGEYYLDTLLSAAQPWVNALGVALVVPAQPGEDATVTASLQPCPEAYRTNETPFCKRIAQTYLHCVGDVYHADIQIFLPGDLGADFAMFMHELGHALGVDGKADVNGHSSDPTSIMAKTIRTPRLMSGAAGPDAPATESPSVAPMQWVREADAESVRRAWSIPR